MWNPISGYGAGCDPGCGIPYLDVDSHIWICLWMRDSVSGYVSGYGSGYGSGCGIPYMDMVPDVFLNVEFHNRFTYLDMILHVESHI